MNYEIKNQVAELDTMSDSLLNMAGIVATGTEPGGNEIPGEGEVGYVESIQNYASEHPIVAVSGGLLTLVTIVGGGLFAMSKMSKPTGQLSEVQVQAGEAKTRANYPLSGGKPKNGNVF